MCPGCLATARGLRLRGLRPPSTLEGDRHPLSGKAATLGRHVHHILHSAAEAFKRPQCVTVLRQSSSSQCRSRRLALSFVVIRAGPGCLCPALCLDRHNKRPLRYAGVARSVAHVPPLAAVTNKGLAFAHTRQERSIVLRSVAVCGGSEFRIQFSNLFIFAQHRRVTAKRRLSTSCSGCRPSSEEPHFLLSIEPRAQEQ